MKSRMILAIVATYAITLSCCCGSKSQQSSTPEQLIKKDTSVVSNYDETNAYLATRRATQGSNRILVGRRDYWFNGNDSIGQYKVCDLITDTTTWNNVVARHLILMNEQDTVAIIDNVMELSTGSLKQQTIKTKEHKISNQITWDENYDNIASLKQIHIEYDAQSGKPTKERQLDATFSYFGVKSMARWSSGMARMLMGHDLDILMFSGLMGIAPVNIPAEVRIFETEATPAPELKILSQTRSEGSIYYEVDKNYLVITEKFYDPHYQDNEFRYEYE